MIAQQQRQGTTIVGVLLVVLGSLFFAIQALGYDMATYGWPTIVVGVGVVLFVAGVISFDPSRGLVVAGAIVTTVGGILLYQNTTGHWESWAYAWALIPASAALGSAIRAALAGDGARVRKEISTTAFFVLLFALGFLFFEGTLRIGGRDFGDLAKYGFPLALIAVGLWMLVARMIAPVRSAGR